MTNKFSEADYNLLHGIVFQEGYPGYRPNVVESPDGDGILDDKKRYAHVAAKYLEVFPNQKLGGLLGMCLAQCHILSCRVADQLDIPHQWWPRAEYGCLRILEYPPGAVTHPHDDFNLFTLMMYRDQPDKFRYIGDKPDREVRNLNSQIHYGELMREIGLRNPTRHEVLPSDTTQHSIVYFAIPDWRARLPSGLTVGDWLKERLSRSRYDATET